MVREGFPSGLAILGDFIRKTQRPIPMRVVFTDGEPMYPRLRETIEEAFSARVSDLYGNTELCGLIHQCEAVRIYTAPDSADLEGLHEQHNPVASCRGCGLAESGVTNRSRC